MYADFFCGECSAAANEELRKRKRAAPGSNSRKRKAGVIDT
jgi:hypothetical protein